MTARTRVLILVKGLGIGGAESLIADAAPYWDRTRFDYLVAYVLPWKDQLAPRLASVGVEVECLDGRVGLEPGSIRRFRRLVRAWRPHLVHAHLPLSGVLARLFAGVPVVYTEHNLPDSYRLPTRILNRLTYRRNAAVVAVSHQVREALSSYPGPEPETVENGVRVDRSELRPAEEVRHELGIGAGVPLVVHVGNIRPHKGHSNLIQATRLLASLVPEVLVVSVGGEKYPGDLRRIREEAEAAGVGDRIRFLGRREDARSFLAAADVVVNPSDFEGLPVVLLEALALERPVVATEVGGVSSLISDRETGRLVPPGDPRALAEAVSEALTSPDAPLWGKVGARLVAERYGLARMVAEYERIYSRVAAS
ncbi:MAG: glycosyl transferase [Acidimicrobiia bacterium]|nr:MAG: glycosyl transferase [Acidimicrobiia bacterium]